MKNQREVAINTLITIPPHTNQIRYNFLQHPRIQQEIELNNGKKIVYSIKSRLFVELFSQF
jgi:hypothetical protein